MKTSNKLITLLFAFILFAILGSGFVLKSRFDGIDKDNPYLGYIQNDLAPFKYVKLTGDAPGTVQLQPGKTFEMHTSEFRNYKDHPEVSHRFSGDTLIIHFKRDGVPNTFWEGTFRYSPSVYVSSPSVPGVTSDQVPCIVSGWKAGDFSIQQSGQGILLSNNNFESLNITAQVGALTKVEKSNTINNASVILKDSSTFISKNDIFQSFDIQLDDASHIDIPGSLMKKQTNSKPEANR